MKHLPGTPGLLIAAVLVAVLGAGCHSLPPLRYYSLAAVSPAAAGHPVLPMLLRVRHVSVPHDMDHLGLTHQVGPTQLSISDNERWTAPLGSLIQGTLTHDLGERLGYEQVLAVDALPVASHPGATQAVLDLDFVALSADQTCGVTAQVNWTVSIAGGATRRGSAQLSAPATDCPSGLPMALSTALGSLADQLVMALSTP